MKLMIINSYDSTVMKRCQQSYVRVVLSVHRFLSQPLLDYCLVSFLWSSFTLSIFQSPWVLPIRLTNAEHLAPFFVEFSTSPRSSDSFICVNASSQTFDHTMSLVSVACRQSNFDLSYDYQYSLLLQHRQRLPVCS
jgi:hypothetical protein